MTLTLYFTPHSCALVSAIALNEAGADFEIRTLDYRRGEQMSADYMRLNPKHKVPLLLIGGEGLTENVAILQWIDARYPAARLLPADGLRRFRAVAFLAWCASGLHPFLTPHVRPERSCDLPGSEEGVKRAAQKMLHEAFGIAEAALGPRDWFFEAYSAADAYFFWAFRRAAQFKIDLSAYPACLAHRKRMEARPAVQKTLALEAEALAGLAQAS
jgi:glutathione S-transferase